MDRPSKSAAQANGCWMPRSPMVSHPSSPVTRRCHIIDHLHSTQVFNRPGRTVFSEGLHQTRRRWRKKLPSERNWQTSLPSRLKAYRYWRRPARWSGAGLSTAKKNRDRYPARASDGCNGDHVSVTCHTFELFSRPSIVPRTDRKGRADEIGAHRSGVSRLSIA